MRFERRPRPRELVRVDPANYYLRLGVSPHASTEEIAVRIRKSRAALKRKIDMRGRAGYCKEEDEITKLDEMLKQIGEEPARTNYDRAHPMNALLTVQERRVDALDHVTSAPHGLVTAWLVAELGPDALLPSPESLALWCPGGVPTELAEALAAFELAPGDFDEPDPEATPEAAQSAALDIPSASAALVFSEGD